MFAWFQFFFWRSYLFIMPSFSHLHCALPSPTPFNACMYFPPYLRTKNFFLSSFPRSFQRFSLKFGENVARSLVKLKTVSKIFLFLLLFACFKSYDHFSEENVCFNNSQNLIKISRHPFLEKVVKRHSDVDRVLPPTSGRKRTYLVILCTLWNRALYSENLNFFYYYFNEYTFVIYNF